MARITIEDCIDKVPNRFHLVHMTAIRAKQLKKGARALVRAEENKAVVTALREIAEGLVSPDYAEELSPVDETSVVPPEPTLSASPAAAPPQESAESSGESGDDEPGAEAGEVVEDPGLESR